MAKKTVVDEILASTAQAGTGLVRDGEGETLTERTIAGMQDVINSQEPIWSLDYDIPTELRRGPCPCPHRLLLWSGAAPFSKSQKVLTQRTLDSQPIQELLALWKEHPAVTARLLRYHDSQINDIKRIVAEELRKEVIKIHTSFINGLGKAADDLKEAQRVMDERAKAGEQITDKDRKRAEAIKDNTIRGILKDATDALGAALTAANAFDETENVKDLFQGLREAIRSQALTFDAQMRQKGAKVSTHDKEIIGKPDIPKFHILRHQDQREYRFHDRSTLGTVAVHYAQDRIVRQVLDLPVEEAEKLWRKLREEGYEKLEKK